mmetsp:Transcript_53622/g.96356  ORF Transcript_53622/g.96356 Transcript_53622/m.96356 type:complete len:1288 (-) Transcript_53622:74-3937(-)
MAAKSTEGNTKRRDFLQKLEEDVQRKWEEMKVFELDAGSPGEDKFMATFPYPYMNGLLHIGHGYTISKADFAVHYQRLLGKKALFPFGWHCTGMPIQAAANKLRREFETFGSPYPMFPPGRPSPKEAEGGVLDLDDDGLTLEFKPPACVGGKQIKVHHILMRISGESEFKEVATAPHPDAETLKSQKKKVVAKAPVESAGCVYKVKTELDDGSFAPESKESDEVSAEAAPKDKKGGKPAPGGKRVAKKILAKSGDAAFQWEILAAMGLKPDDIPPFTEPTHWLEYYPPLGMRDLKRWGAPVDWRRTFMTTSINPYYDKFIRWQFSKLKAGNKIGFGKRPTIFSELDGQACMDHDRAEGEGVAPQEYTGIKLQLLELPAAMAKLKGKTVFLVAATLRPETMCGQTNCWILPEGKYGCFKASGDDVYVCSHRAARNMSFQDILMPWGKPECLLDVTGKDLMGAKLKAPTSPYDAVHLLPLLTIKMDKGTGIVTSVPSDSPDDYAAFMDLMKPGKRDHLGIKAEWVEPFKLIPIIDVEIDGEIRNMAAEYMCEKLGVQSQKDKEKLLEAHDVCYKLGFDKGIMTAGPMKGKPVKVAKTELKAKMVSESQAFTYSEPEKKVVSRSGDECVVAGIDQWYLKYGEASWRGQIEGHVNSSNFNCYNERNRDSFNDAIGWLKEWACSRSFGLGTQVPWDEQFVIESLSDSTIYMAYYSIAHILQDGVMDGSKGNPSGIKPEELTYDVFDYVFLDGAMPKDKAWKSKKAILEKMRKEFRYWYPMDLRVSGKDLIQNHLTMCLYNHACVWEKEPELWPRSMFCNGWLLVDSEKMSKSKGNFFTMTEIMQMYTADTVRLACANAGDTLEDANLEQEVAKKAVLKFPVILETLQMFMNGKEPSMEGPDDSRFVDKWFANEMNRLVVETKKHYEAMYYREALRTGYYEFTALFDDYRDICRSKIGLPHKGLVMRYFEWWLIIFSPICPHFTEHCWGELGKPGTILDARFPEPLKAIDENITLMGKYIFDEVPHDCIKLKEKFEDKVATALSATFYVALSFPDWKVKVLELMRKKHAEGALTLVNQEGLKADDVANGQWKAFIGDVMQDPNLKKFGKHVGPFAAFKRDEAFAMGVGALESTVPFDEMGLLSEHIPYLQEKLAVTVSVLDSEKAQAKEHQEAAGLAQPGKPGVYYQPGEAVAKAKPAAKKGGGKAEKPAAKSDAKAAAPSSKNGSAPGTITDLKKLNEHLSTRSYFEGGPRPTQADVAQLAATPTVSAEEFPHVYRWRKHIGYFTEAQKARW